MKIVHKRPQFGAILFSLNQNGSLPHQNQQDAPMGLGDGNITRHKKTTPSISSVRTA
jgi:hypothetical protein